MQQEKAEEIINPPKKSVFRENFEAIIIAVILALFIRTFVVQAFKIPSGSMKQTLLIGDHILVNKFIYGVKIPFSDKTIIEFKKPKRGDIVVFKYPMDPKKDFIKRVIGVAGDVVMIRDKEVFVNGKRIEQDYAIHLDSHVIPAELQPRDNFGPVTVPDHSLFVMGDNRDHSYDSRFWGFVDLDAVKGKAFVVYFSGIIPWAFDWPWDWNWDRFVIRWDRTFQPLR